MSDRRTFPGPVPSRVAIAGLAVAATVLAVASAVLAADPQPLPDYRTETEFLPATPSVTGGAVGALGNPAAWATGDRVEYAFWWDEQDLGGSPLENWGFSLGRNLGLAANSHSFRAGTGLARVTDLQFGLALGGRGGALGLAYRWATGDTDLLPREQALTAGLIRRPSRYVAWGLSGTKSVQSPARFCVADLGIRPLGDDLVTLFADYSLERGEKPDEGFWGAGVEVRPVDGLFLGAKWRDTGHGDARLTVSAGVNLLDLGYRALSSYDDDGHHVLTTHLFDLHPSSPSLGAEALGIFFPVDLLRRYVPINLEHKQVTYRKYQWFDDGRVAWIDLARFLRRLRDEPKVDGVVLNLCGTSMRPSIAWELRQLLTELQAAGKEVVIHLDRAGMSLYALASVADRLTIDPQGTLLLPGSAMTRTYLKGTLAKLGIGFQELRYFRYKSAMEGYGRDDMSAADREQRQRIVDVLYETTRAEATGGRGLDAGAFDRIVDEEAFILPERAKELGLVDAVARWRDVREWLYKERRAGLAPPPPRDVRDFREQTWGPLPRIAVVYAVGECAMDSGIKGRATSAYMRRLAGDPTVAAVVLRADSPGGDPLPSDLVAEACRILREAGKPVIVSQGDVAASGGYWISMDGDRILTTPVTITGSIGVIAGWFWDDGLGEKTGLSDDGVQRGRHADLFAPLRFPFVGGMIPTRPLDEEELAVAKGRIESMYDGFVSRVAAARGIDSTRVRDLAQGRVWMGGDAVERGLVDGLGTLMDAIDLAKEGAGIPAARRISIVEYPPRPLVELPFPRALRSPFPFGWLAGLLGVRGTRAGELAEFAAEVCGRVDGGDGAAAAAAAIAGVRAGATPAAVGVAGDGTGEQDYGYLYLKSLAEDPGRPRLLLPPEYLPEAWGSGD